jgi:hypothetical protein
LWRREALAGKNCQAVIFQPYVMRIRYNATITQSCPQFSDNTYGPSPGAPVYLYNQTVDIPEYYTKNGKNWAEGSTTAGAIASTPTSTKRDVRPTRRHRPRLQAAGKWRF